MKSLKTRIKNMHLRTKLLLSYSLIVFIPLTVIGILLVGNVIRESVNQDRLSGKNSFSQTLSAVDNFFSGYTTLSNSIKYDSYLTDYLVKQYTPATEYIDKYFEYYEIYTTYNKRLSYQRLDGTKFHVYTTNSEILCYNNFIYRSTSSILNSVWYRLALKNKGNINLCAPALISGKYMIPMATSLTPKSSVENILRIDIPEDDLTGLIGSMSEGKPVYIVNETFDIIASTDEKSIARNLRATDFKSILSKIAHTDDETVLLNGNETVYIGRVGAGTKLGNCWMIEVFQSAPILSHIYKMAGFSLGVCIFVAIVDIFLIFLLSHQISAKIGSLVAAVRAVRAGNMHIDVSREGEDEISELSRSFAEMMDRINTLIDKVYLSELHGKESELKAREAEIHALQSQINPHFLFNSLNSINTSALVHKDFVTSDIIVSFASLIRKSIEWKSDFIPLSSEIQLVRDYLKIQSFRYRNKLKYKIRIDRRFDSVIVPKFILQPLIENSVCHGVESRAAGGTIDIFCEQCGESLKITVSDNGVGMSAEKLEKIRNLIDHWDKNTDSEHIGILNVQQRLKLYYGDEFGMEINSEPDKGTQVSITLPIRGRPVTSAGFKAGNPG